MRLFEQNMCFIIFLCIVLLVDPILGICPDKTYFFFLRTFTTPRVVVIRDSIIPITIYLCCFRQFEGSSRCLQPKNCIQRNFFYNRLPTAQQNFVLFCFQFTFSVIKIKGNYYLIDYKEFRDTESKLGQEVGNVHIYKCIPRY